jgi:hypothetical protein
MKEAYPEQVRQCVFYITSVYARSSLNINNSKNNSLHSYGKHKICLQFQISSAFSVFWGGQADSHYEDVHRTKSV